MRIILSFLFAAGLFLMPPAQAASLTVYNPAGQSEDGVYVDTILASSSGTAVDFPRADTETIEAAGDGLEAFNALFLARGWGDGLPLVPPTPERVKAMLAGYDLPDDFPIATLPPLDGVPQWGRSRSTPSWRDASRGTCPCSWRRWKPSASRNSTCAA